MGYSEDPTKVFPFDDSTGDESRMAVTRGTTKSSKLEPNNGNWWSMKHRNPVSEDILSFFVPKIFYGIVMATPLWVDYVRVQEVLNIKTIVVDTLPNRCVEYSSKIVDDRIIRKEVLVFLLRMMMVKNEGQSCISEAFTCQTNTAAVYVRSWRTASFSSFFLLDTLRRSWEQLIQAAIVSSLFLHKSNIKERPHQNPLPKGHQHVQP